jgi:hypothetical protein
MIKPEDIIIEVQRTNLSRDKRYPKWRTTVTASIQVGESLMIDPRWEGYGDSRILEEVKAKLRRAVWDRIYEPGVYRSKVFGALDAARDSVTQWGNVISDAMNGIIGYLDMPRLPDDPKPRTILMDNGSSIRIDKGAGDTIRGGPNLAS